MVKVIPYENEKVDTISPLSICLLNNATVIPLMLGSTPKVIKGGVNHPAMDEKFHQYRGAAINKRQAEPDLATDVDFIMSFNRNFFSSRGNFVYGGPIISNFGHFLAECIHRCWAYEFTEEKLELKVNKVLFIPQTNRSFSWLQAQKYQLPPVYLEILNYLGIPSNKVQCVFTPKTLKNLIVPQQASIFRSKQPITETYLQFLDRCEVRNQTVVHQPLYKKMYVSRRYFALRGAYAGESYIEDFLQKNGFHIYYPEQHSISSQLSMYKGAEEIIFAEGAALHVLELLGHLDAHISVISRRSLSSDIFKPLLSSRVKSLSIMSEVETLPSLFFTKDNDKAAHGSAISILNVQALMSFLGTFHNLNISLFEPFTFSKNVKQDLNNYLTYYTNKISTNESKKIDATIKFKLVFDKHFPKAKVRLV